MDDFISQNNLESIYKKEIKEIGKKGLEDKVKNKRNDSNRNSKRTIFLCHSHLDKTIVKKIAIIFEKLSTEIYIDWLDDAMPLTTNINTAKSIKLKIQKTHKFLFLATYHGVRSKWCNWELGIADATNINLAILPILAKSGKWTGNEYLNLYPEMKINSDNLENIKINDIIILNLDGTSISIEQWLKQS